MRTCTDPWPRTPPTLQAPEILICPDKRRPEENKDLVLLAYTELVGALSWLWGALGRIQGESGRDVGRGGGCSGELSCLTASSDVVASRLTCAVCCILLMLLIRPCLAY